VTRNLGSFTRFKQAIGNQNVKFAAGQSHKVHGKGSILVSNNGDVKHIDDNFYVPNITNNLLSMGTIADKGCLVIFGANKCWVLSAKQPSKVLAMGTRNTSNGLYQMQMELQQLTTLMMEINSIVVATIELWHKRLGRFHYQGLQVLSNLRTFTRDAIDFHDVKHLQALRDWEVAQRTYTKGEST
jgi:hypothetical protein